MSKPREVNKEINEYLRELNLPAMRRSFEDKARQAERETMGYEQFLLELVERECQERRTNRIKRLLQLSQLPLEKTLDNFNRKRLPPKAGRQVKALRDGNKDPMTTASAIDRLVHHSVILELNIGRYRVEEAKKNRPGEEP